MSQDLVEKTPLSGLANFLVQQKILNDFDVRSIFDQSRAMGITFVSHLINTKKISPRSLAELAAERYGLVFVDLDAIDTQYCPRGIVDMKLVERRRVLPLFKRGQKVFIGISDPSDQHLLNEVKFQTGLAVEPVIVEEDKLDKMIRRLIDDSDTTLKSLVEDDFSGIEFEAADDANDESQVDSDVDDAPVVKFIHKVLLDGINCGASDIHFEPYEKYYRIRYRTDGVLTEVSTPPLILKDKISSRIKVISRLDIAEKRLPQDGRMKLVLSKTRAIDFRVSTLPTLHGEKIVMRILDPASATLGIDALGYDPEDKEKLMEAISRPYGMVLVTGPTGSGKTVSLYTCLNILNEPGINISTAEDPAEINLAGINQVNVNDKAGLSFSVALKSFLRQDPDIIMVGEIRDLETADIAIKAAQTGHLVLSTLHTNDAPGTLTRLMNMGVAPFNIASSVHLITAQRLARKLCSTCKTTVDIPDDVLYRAGFTDADVIGRSWQLYAPKEGGCEHCRETGYKGRVGIYQVMPISDAMSRIIMCNGTAHDIADQAKSEGVPTLREAGLRKVKAGITSLQEIETVTIL